MDNSLERIHKLARSHSRSEIQSNQENLYRPEYLLDGQENKCQILWSLMKKYSPIDIKHIQTSIVHHVEYTMAKNRFTFDNHHCYKAVAHSIRDRLIETYNDTNSYIHQKQPKRLYYFSMEYLLGRYLQNTLVNLKLNNQYKKALLEIGFNLENLYEVENDPGLGNGGLGRLAACFLDSLATLDYPAWGYGIRYDYGIFQQKIIDYEQVEIPDYWLKHGNPWEIERNDFQYEVGFYGQVLDGEWKPKEFVIAQAYDNPIPGYNTFNSINLRLWRSLPSQILDFQEFNKGDYFKAIQQKQQAELITSVLYPNDYTDSGKELRIKQQYFFVSASLQDLIRRYKKQNSSWEMFPFKIAMQLNDTHPALAIIELLRILIDIEKVSKDLAFDICYNTFSYTNHTILPEALEKWNCELIQRILPRHLEIIFEMNFHWLLKVQKLYPDNMDKIKQLSLVIEGAPKMINMSNLCIISCHQINGVSQIHTQILKNHVFKDFYEMTPKKFKNITNGCSPRRCANKPLSDLYYKYLNQPSNKKQKKFQDWLDDITMIKKLEYHVDDQTFQCEWQSIKQENKKQLARYIQNEVNIKVDPNSLFDVQIKRFHEYKRQLMNILFVIHRYLELKENKTFQSRTVIFSGKAAPGYYIAKQTIKLINMVADVINKDQQTNNYLKVVFLQNYNAEKIIPASDISQHISLAGTEASGTGNMKFSMNGCLILGTLDGANIEIRDEIGHENMYIFGTTIEEVPQALMEMKIKNNYIPENLKNVIRSLYSGVFGDFQLFEPLIKSFTQNNDNYLISKDFDQYCKAQDQIDIDFQNKELWTKKSIQTAIRSLKFSSDRSIDEYADQIWQIRPLTVPNPATSQSQKFRAHHKLSF